VDYGRYRDTVGDWRNDLDYLYGKYGSMSQDEYNRYLNDRQSWENDRAYWYQNAQDQMNWDWMREQFEYQKQQDELARQKSSGGSSRRSNSGSNASMAGILNVPNTALQGAAAGLLAAAGNLPKPSANNGKDTYNGSNAQKRHTSKVNQNSTLRYLYDR
jgi:hypothetical protein